ncbi:ADP-ribosylation factor-like protein 6-interacting protein 4 [Sabethes cyaneus]|uniref:ADP-ribosylation factor-like protein 6-interacting protein 4 n=1 Tax=Sabethes cyaneus TaxID=53552 RepID=UPI00237DCB3D|nr:ADP-ribosylation factor-like protein 6-interacting protein 4 [Sabethes cyaneus]
MKVDKSSLRISRHASPSSDSSSNCSSIEIKHRKKSEAVPKKTKGRLNLQKSLEKEAKRERKSAKLEKKLLKHQRKMARKTEKQLRKLQKKELRMARKTSTIASDEDCGVPLELMDTTARAPETREQYEARQAVVRRIVDPETGRTRLIKGDGEIIEECVSRERHYEINRLATAVDGAEFYRKSIELNVKI